MERWGRHGHTAGMRSSHRKPIDRTALLSIVGNSVMSVVTGSRGFDDDELLEGAHPAFESTAA
jgi:hypothetical protein